MQEVKFYDKDGCEMESAQFRIKVNNYREDVAPLWVCKDTHTRFFVVLEDVCIGLFDTIQDALYFATFGDDYA